MKFKIHRLSAVLLIMLQTTAFAKAGYNVPPPSLDAIAAVKLAKTKILKEVQLGDSSFFIPKEYIVTLVKYTNRYRGKRFKNWAWVIELKHPQANDHSATYKIAGPDAVELLRVTR